MRLAIALLAYHALLTVATVAKPLAIHGLILFGLASPALAFGLGFCATAYQLLTMFRAGTLANVRQVLDAKLTPGTMFAKPWKWLYHLPRGPKPRQEEFEAARRELLQFAFAPICSLAGLAAQMIASASWGLLVLDK